MTVESVFGNESLAAVIGAVSGALASDGVNYFDRKKMRAQFISDQMLDLLDDIDFESRDYWRSNGQNKPQEVLIKRKFDSLYKKLERFSWRKQEFIKPHLDYFNDDCTGDEFETLNRIADFVRAERIKVRSKAIRDILNRN